MSSTSSTSTDEPKAGVVREGIDFASAKNFWQTRAARADADSATTTTASTASSASASSTSAPVNVAPLSPTTNGPSTPVEEFPGELEEPPEPVAKTEPPPAPVTAPSALTRMTSMTSMTSLRSKFFTSGSSGSVASESKEAADTSPSASLPAIPVPQLPDMSAWKDKMKMSRPSPPKMNFSFRDISAQLKTSLSTATAAAGPDPEKLALARNNIQWPTQKHTRRTSSSAAASDASNSAFGELVVAEVLAAKELSAGDFFQGESDPYVVVRFRDWERRTTIVKGTKSPVFNERFVFWIPSASSSSSSSSGDQEEFAEPPLVSVLVMNKNLVMSDMHLGEVHISLDVPLNEAFDEWYPLVKENGEQQGHVRVGVRRMELTSMELQQAAQALAAHNRSLNDEDLAAFGAVLPDLWYGFAEAAEPLEEKASQADVLATKLNDLSRRFIGIELTSTELTADGKRRDIF